MKKTTEQKKMKSLEKRFKEIMMKHLQTNSAYTVTLSEGLYWELIDAVKKYYRDSTKTYTFTILGFGKMGEKIAVMKSKFFSNLREK